MSQYASVPQQIDARIVEVDTELDALVSRRAEINVEVKALRSERESLGRARRAFNPPKPRRSGGSA